ncbi:unnamed protein product [Orchesella dallaii]|uniref:Uncharacterized protein n=1 Tax=Orchesella dallaii TaxID=48710 RepID=A0ABP1QIW0_9HEXA
MNEKLRDSLNNMAQGRLLKALFTVLALVVVALAAQLPVKKDGAVAPTSGGDLKTASSFIGPFGIGWGWGGYPYWGYGWGGYGGYGYGGWGYPYWG